MYVLPPAPARGLPPRDGQPCAVQVALAPLAGPWAVLVVGRLARGSARFGQLREALVRPDGRGVSARVLAAELRRLAAADVVERDARGSGVAYRLSARGRALVPLLDAVAHWADTAPDAASADRPAHRSAA